MSEAHVTTVPRARLDDAVRRAPQHLRPLWEAVRDWNCTHAFIQQGKARFALAPDRRPCIALIGDDMHTSLGPDGFHRKSLRRLIERCSAAGVMVGLEPQAYQRVCTNAVLLRQNVVIVETRTQHEIEWVNFLREVNPQIGMLVAYDAEAQAGHA